MYNHKRLQSKHYEIIRRSFIGQSNKDIASELGMTPMAISIVLNCSLAKMELARLRSEADDKLTNQPARTRLGKELNELADLSVKQHLRILKGEEAADIKTKARIADTHIKDGIYKTETPDDKVSFRDLIRGLSAVERATKELVMPVVIETTGEEVSS